MTDKEFVRIVRQLCKAENKARKLREIAEEEYERRYGNNPSDIDDDNWIDLTGAIGYASEKLTLKDIERGIKIEK